MIGSCIELIGQQIKVLIYIQKLEECYKFLNVWDEVLLESQTQYMYIKLDLFIFLSRYCSSKSTSIAVLCITGLIPLGTRKRSPFFGGKNGRSDPASYKNKKYRCCQNSFI